MVAERVALYHIFTLTGQIIPVYVISLPVEYYIPEKAEVAEAVKRLCMNQLGGPLVIWAEYIHQWL